jgi:hypothetical protein
MLLTRRKVRVAAGTGEVSSLVRQDGHPSTGAAHENMALVL